MTATNTTTITDHNIHDSAAGIQRNKAVIRNFQTALANKLSGADEDLSAWFCDDAIWHLPQSCAAMASRADFHGRDAILAMVGADVDVFYDPASIRFDYHHITAEADRVHVHFTMYARTSNGRDYENQYQSLFKLRDGRIAEAWEFMDTAYLFSLFSD